MHKHIICNDKLGRVDLQKYALTNIGNADNYAIILCGVNVKKKGFFCSITLPGCEYSAVKNPRWSIFTSTGPSTVAIVEFLYTIPKTLLNSHYKSKERYIIDPRIMTFFKHAV